MSTTVAARTTSAASSLPYMPGLDVARGIAILAVLLDHGLASQSLGRPGKAVFLLRYGLRFGHMGVHLFFILSGFLITSILLDSQGTPDYFKNFYTRRVLRILPAYLLMVFVLFVTHSITVRYVAVCLLFLCNMPGLLGASPEYSSLWSLSVEEQFYLVWPMIVRRLSPRRIAILCGGIIVFTPILRFILLYGPMFLQDVRFKTWAVADFFAAGALLATLARQPEWDAAQRRAIPVLLLAGAGLSILQQLLPRPHTRGLIEFSHAVFLEPWLLGLSGLMLLLLLHPLVASRAAFRPLVFLARISYGLYLCHVLLFRLIERHWRIHASSQGMYVGELVARFVCEVGVSIAIATLSRNTYEEFFLRMKPKRERSASSCIAS